MSAPRPQINRDEIEPHSVGAGELAFTRQRLAGAARPARIGASLYSGPAGARQMPVHVHGDEEEIFFILAGDGLSWQGERACAVGAGDVVVHRPREDAHTFLAGAPAHCHALEEELFFVLAGNGTLTLGGLEHPLRAGGVIARPPATGVCHAIRPWDASLEDL